MTGSEQRKIMCSVTFHIIAITCVVWSLYVLIDRTAEEIKHGESTGMLFYFLSNKREYLSHDKLAKIRETFLYVILSFIRMALCVLHCIPLMKMMHPCFSFILLFLFCRLVLSF